MSEHDERPQSPQDVITEALTRLSADQRRTVAYYGNVRGLPGISRRPRRLISEFGFPENISFQYIVPADDHIVRHEEARTITSVTLYAVGIDADHRRLTSVRPEDRRVRTQVNARSSGVRLVPFDTRYIMAANLDDATASAEKLVNIIDRTVTARRGPAYHFIISRQGSIYVGASLDDETTASRLRSATTVDVALEGALAISREDHEARSFEDKIFELPYTAVQMQVLAVLLAKIKAAYSLPTELDVDLFYEWPDEALPHVLRFNFSSGAWEGQAAFSHARSDVPAIFASVGDVEPFDLATQVYIPSNTQATAPPPIATRARAQTVIGTIDTVGDQSVSMHNYASLASPERAAAMQSNVRAQFFVERVNMAHRDADDVAEGATHTAVSHAGELPPAPAGVDPHVYDYLTGRWGDGRTF